MATALKHGSQENFTSRSLHSAVLNPVGSKTFLKKMIPMAVSFILHQRVELDKNDFNKRSYEGLEYKVFKPNMRSAILQEISKWIVGALDALEKNYLREIYLVFESSEDPGTIYESYKFQFKYMGKDVIPLDTQISTKRELKDATKGLLTSINSLSEYQPFKESEIKIKMALTYYEDVTPPTYHPPHFGSESENVSSVLKSLTMQPRDYLHLGILKTGYHIVKCRAKGEAFSMNRSVSSITSMAQSENNVETVEVNTQYEDAVETIEVENSEPIIMNEVSDGDVITMTKNFTCICNINVELNHVDAILCAKCSKFQHCACLGYLQRGDMPNEYVCPNCDINKKQLYDEKEKQQRIAIMRLLVAVAYFTEEVPRDLLKMLPEDTAEFTFKKLVEQKVMLRKHGKYVVNMKLIKMRFLQALFMINSQEMNNVPNSMNLRDVDMSQNSMVLGGETKKKK